MKAAVVVPTNRPERITGFIKAWQEQFNRPDVRLLVIEDFPQRQSVLPEWAEHYCHEDIDRELGDSAWCIPRQAGGVRSFGFWKAAQDETVDMIVSLDDDVKPSREWDSNLLADHWRSLEAPQQLRWQRTSQRVRTRGYPYTLGEGVKSVLNHGLWEGVADIDAIEQLTTEMDDHCYSWESHLVPPGVYYTMCIMNVAFRREFAPFMFMPPFPDGMKRWDDIWCGIIAKRIADLHGWAVTSGKPLVHHERASNPLNNLRQEFLGYGINEELWETVDSAGHKDDTPGCTYLNIVDAIEDRFPILGQATHAMRRWAELWAESEESIPLASHPISASRPPSTTICGQGYARPFVGTSVGTYRCQRCGHEWSNGATVCPACGK